VINEPSIAFRSWVSPQTETPVLDIAANAAGRAASAGGTIGLGTNSAKKRQEGCMIAE
jgi:hypothetical protein